MFDSPMHSQLAILKGHVSLQRDMLYPPKFWECPSKGCPWSAPPAGDSEGERRTATNKLFKHLEVSQGCLGSAGYPDLMTFKEVNRNVFI